MSLTQLLDKIRAYNPDGDLDLVRNAYAYAKEKHEGQTRASGDPYFAHPLTVADIVAELRLDDESLAAALLHDTVEDTGATVEEIKKRFGEDVGAIVAGLTTLSSVHFRSKKISQAENFRKMLVAMSKDIRVLLVKLADRLHNMRTLEHLPNDIQTYVARETMDIYAPLANRLGIAWIKTELEDLAFRYLFPEEYQALRSLVAKRRREREDYMEEVEQVIRKALDERGYDDAKVHGRAKHFYSIYRKMKLRGIEFDQVYDLIAFRVIVETVPQCYEVLGIIHTIWRPVPGRFKDYIALPKKNGYQSLHTAVIGLHGERLEIQIRTQEMHRVGEQGIAAHWKYKEGGRTALTDRDEENFSWLKQLIEWQQELRDPAEFLDAVKVDLFPEEVYTFTPGGDLKVLPRGASPVDFAYAVHTEVGHACVGAKVNGRMVPLSTELHNGDRIQVLTQKASRPSRDWLKHVKSSTARNKIRAFLRREQRKMSREIGRGMIEKELRKFGKGWEKQLKSGDIGRAAREMKIQTVDELCVLVGYRKITPERVVENILPPEERGIKPESELAADSDLPEKAEPSPPRGASAVQIDGIDDMLIRFAKCCQPVRGDEVVGFVTRGRGVTIHLRSCSYAQSQPPERMFDVDWRDETGQKYIIRLRVTSADRKGILLKLTDAINTAGINITQAICNTSNDGRASNTFALAVTDRGQLRGVMHALRRVGGVIEVARLRSG